MVLSEEEVISKSLKASYFGFNKEISGIGVGDKVKVWYDAMYTMDLVGANNLISDKRYHGGV